jgi:hypothetical protein
VQRIAQREQGKARDKAAELMGINRQYVSDAKRIAKEAPEILNRHRAAMRWRAVLGVVASGEDVHLHCSLNLAPYFANICLTLSGSGGVGSWLTSLKTFSDPGGLVVSKTHNGSVPVLLNPCHTWRGE